MAMCILNKENLMFPKGIDSGLVKVEEFLTKVLGIIIRCFAVWYFSRTRQTDIVYIDLILKGL